MEQKSKQTGAQKKSKRKFSASATLSYVLFVLATSIILSTMAILVANDMFGLVQAEETVNINLQEGATVSQVAKKLKETGVIEYKWAFKLFAGLKNVKSFSTGEFELVCNMDYGQIIDELKRSTTSTDTVTLTIPEGYNLEQIAKLFEDSRVCGRKEFFDAANNYQFSHEFLKDVPMTENRLEGYLFPDTYQFYINEKPVSAINKMLNNFNKKYTEEMRKLTEKAGMTIAEVVNIASLIEKEAKLDDERAVISGVIHNRLNHPAEYPYLDIDAALLYVTGHKTEITAEDLQLDSPYNLRKSRGLPPTAICNPGVPAMLAAITPQEHGYYYYVYNPKTEKHIFSKTLEEHNAAVASVK